MASDTAEEDLMLPLAKRPDKGGSKGQKIALITNYLHLEPGKDMAQCLYQYDVAIRRSSAPEETGAAERKERGVKAEEAERNWRVYMKLKSDMPDVFKGLAFAYDRQKILISLDRLHDANEPQKPMKFEVFHVPMGENRYDNFKVTITLANKVTMFDSDGMLDRGVGGKTTFVQAIDLILRQHQFFIAQLIPTGKGFFNPLNPIELEGDFRRPSGRLLMQGWFSAVRPVQLYRSAGRRSDASILPLALNVDVTTSVFYKTSHVIEYISTVVGNNQILAWDAFTWKKVEKALKVIRLDAPHSGFSVKLKGLSPFSAREHKFPVPKADGSVEEVTVEKYFLERYNIRLQFPTIPLGWSGPASRRRQFPLEVLWVAKGQRIPNSRLKPKETAQMIKVTAVKPPDRLAKIRKAIEESQLGMDDITRAFGLQMADVDLIKLDGRVLPPSQIAYKESEGGGRLVIPLRGAWDMRGNRFCVGAEITKWAACLFDPDKENLFADPYENVREFCGWIVHYARELGVTISDVDPRIKVLRDRSQMNQMFEMYKNGGVQLLMCFIKQKGDPIYRDIKKGAETEHGVMTQCITMKVLSDGMVAGPRTDSLYTNICLKINAKMGGINNSISPRADDAIGKSLVSENDATLFVGADVTHPAPGQISPSIAAVCANVNTPPTKYVGNISVQIGRQEIIGDLRNLIKLSIRSYYKATKKKPSKIIFYRDGVSEGQFREVMRKELAEIRFACQEIEKDYEPPITFIVVQKRHHTRFFKQQIQDQRDANIPPGTVVDTVVTHPTEFDFYLCSHQGIQGTSKATKYSVLRDENNFTSDDLQSLSYHLCHVFARCNRSVSLPAPVFYADRLAFRARLYIGGEFESMSTVSGDDVEIDVAEGNRRATLHEGIKKEMFFI